MNSEAETDPQTLGGEHGETVQVWLPAQKHEITHSHLLDPSDVIAEITLCKTKMKYLTMSSALKKLQEKETACNLSTVLDKHSDLVPAVYEGGLTIWECTWDLLNHLADMDIIFKNKRVLEIGCGAALPAIFCALHGAHITLQDYNEEVVNFVTIPNVALNLYNKTSRNASAKDEHLTESLSSKATFYSGDWAAVNQLLSSQCEYENEQTENIRKDADGEERKFDLILTSETIYNPSCHKKLLDLMTAHLKHDGLILLAAKTHYFGVGGGTQQFADLVKTQGQLDVHFITSNNSGVKREIIQMKFKN